MYIRLVVGLFTSGDSCKGKATWGPQGQVSCFLIYKAVSRPGLYCFTLGAVVIRLTKVCRGKQTKVVATGSGHHFVLSDLNEHCCPIKYLLRHPAGRKNSQKCTKPVCNLLNIVLFLLEQEKFLWRVVIIFKGVTLYTFPVTLFSTPAKQRSQD